MSIPFPAGVLCTRPNKGGRGPDIPLEDKHFCVGQDTRLRLWYGRRSQLDVDRGPYTLPSAFFYYYLEPTDNCRRKDRNGAPKSSSEGTGLSGVGGKVTGTRSSRRRTTSRTWTAISSRCHSSPGALRHFRIGHPDFQQNNVVVSRSPHSNWQVVDLFDWQHASILSRFSLRVYPNTSRTTSQVTLPNLQTLYISNTDDQLVPCGRRI